jgi:putative two-component system response regulator
MKRILCVSNDARQHRQLGSWRRSHFDRWSFGFASSLHQAIQASRREAFDAVLIDMKMPEAAGILLLQMLRSDERSRRWPVVVLVDEDQRRDVGCLIELGADDFLHKPLDAVSTQVRLNNVIRARESREELAAQNAALEAIIRERTDEAEKSRRELIYRLAMAAETRDTDTGNHIVRVGQFAGVIADVCGLPSRYCGALTLTAPLHDIGKLGIPDSILRKPGPLTPEERVEMQDHCRIGAHILQGDPEVRFCANEVHASFDSERSLLDQAATIALCHHERWDGEGYPNKLAGEEIPLAARIVALADVFDALRIQRPYKPAMSLEEACAIMSSGVGTQFDPEVYHAFEKSLPRLEEIWDTLKDPDVNLLQAA